MRSWNFDVKKINAQILKTVKASQNVKFVTCKMMLGIEKNQKCAISNMNEPELVGQTGSEMSKSAFVARFKTECKSRAKCG